MSKKLDDFRPNFKMLQDVAYTLVEAGMSPQEIDQPTLERFIAATCKYLASTPEGLIHNVALMRFQFERGKQGEVYLHTDRSTGQRRELKPEQVDFFYGAAVEGKAVNPHDIVIAKQDLVACDSCGIKTHCTKNLRNPGTDRAETLCNTCTALHDDPRMSQFAYLGTCQECVAKSCFHHPENRKRIA
jgi:hypothetical protein